MLVKKGYITFTIINPTTVSPAVPRDRMSFHIDFKSPFVGLQDNPEEEEKKDIHVENTLLESPDMLSPAFSYSPNPDEQDDDDDVTFVGDDEGI